MIVKSLTKTAKGYEVFIEEQPFILEEEVILKFRLFEGKFIEESHIEDILKANTYEEFKKKALAYHLRYLKSSQEAQNYLIQKGITKSLAQQMIQDLVNNKYIDDYCLAKGIAGSLARNSNGPKQIIYKLKNHLFSEDLISKVVEQIEPEDYNLGVDKLYKKGLQKYQKLDEFQQKIKIKNLFYQHGYPNTDLL